MNSEPINNEQLNSDNPGTAKTVLNLALFVVLLILLIYFYRGYKLERLEIITYGEEVYTYEELGSRLLSGPFDSYACLFYLREKYIQNETIPFVESYEVELNDKNSCTVYVYYKAVSGCFEVMDRYVYFDLDGRVIETGTERRQGVPVVKGISIKNVVKGSIPEVETPFVYGTIIDMVLALRRFGIEADDITFSQRREVTLHIDDDEILLGKREDYEFAIANLKNVLESVGEGSYRFDMRNYSEDNKEVSARKIQ